MRDSNMRIVLPLVIASLLPGCTHNPAPKAWRPRPAEAQHNSRGAWTVVESLASEAQSQEVSYVEGELIAVDDDAFHVLAATGLRSVSRYCRRRSQLGSRYAIQSAAAAATSTPPPITSMRQR